MMLVNPASFAFLLGCFLTASLDSGVAVPVAGSTTSNSSSARPATINPNTILLPNLVHPTLQTQLEGMLMMLPGNASQRWSLASPIAATSLGSNDTTNSNKALSDLVDRTFDKSDSNARWVDTYIKFLIEAGNDNLGTDDQTDDIIDSYSKAYTAFAPVQMKLLKAYDDANPNVTNIGSDIKGMKKINPLTVTKMEHWARDGKDSSEFSKGDWEKYIKLNKTLADILPKFQRLSQALQITTQGYVYEHTINNAPGIFNLSMIIDGDVTSSNAQFAPAWTAIVINATVLASQDAKNLSKNLDLDLRVGTINDTSFSNPPGSDDDDNDSFSSSTSSCSRSKSSSTSSSASASSTASSKQHESSDESTHHTRNFERPQKRGSSTLQIVANDAQKKDKESQPIKVAGVSKERVSSAPKKSNNSSNSPDPLSGVPTTRQGNLMLLEIRPGSWAVQQDDFLAFAQKSSPKIFKKYFGTSDEGWKDGPIGRMWTHVVLVTLNKENSTELESVQVLGKVWDVTPGLQS